MSVVFQDLVQIGGIGTFTIKRKMDSLNILNNQLQIQISTIKIAFCVHEIEQHHGFNCVYFSC